MSGTLALGIDVGGTFTDLVVHDALSGRQASHKQLTTPSDPARGVLAGVDRLLADGGIAPEDIGRVVHATTLFSNALIERKGATTGLITTAGFRDTLEIGRERKFELYDIKIVKPSPLVPRRLRLEVSERIMVDGSVHRALEPSEVLAAAARLAAAGVTSTAIVFLHSYVNPRHEQLAAELIAERFPGMSVSASIDVAPEIREYERVSTTVINAYIKPLAEGYLSALADRLAGRGIAAPMLLMLSNGGLTSVADAKRTPVRLLESGPAAGVLVAAHLAAQAGEKAVLAFDMGGTTAKLGMVEDGKPAVAYAFEAARARRFIAGSGLPVRISTVELIEIGAGGGSIAQLDVLGLLKVGPDSAGAEPGPAAYGRGGKQPTVTDAGFVLGYLDPRSFAAGSMAIDVDAAAAALRPLASRAELGLTELAWGVHDLVNENMANAARVHIAEHGKDPRSYTLVATGGAGPLHAYHVAKKLGIARFVAPRAAGVASALGLLIAPARVDRVASVARDIEQIAWPELEAKFAQLEEEARAVLATALPNGAAEIARLADMRYVGQASELVVALPRGRFGNDARSVLLQAFERSYVAAFTRTPPARRVEIINVRVSAQAAITSAGLPPTSSRPGLRSAVKGSRAVYLPEWRGFRPIPVYDRDALSPGLTVDGPAIVEERSSTLLVGAGRLAVAPNGSILVTIA